MTERYELVGPLGTGGMAEVMLARRLGPNGFERLLAVKRIRPERAQDPDAVRMLLDEARIAASLVHQRIVQVFDIGMRDGAVELAMEYLHGRTLDDVISRAPKLPLESALAITIAIADGLHHAHTRGVVHRDVAPSNVMITYDGSVKLIDFGIAKSASNISNTVFGTFKGRLGYSSPEQCRCEPADARSDIYSLAVLLYEMTTGARAFTAKDEQAMLAVMTEARIAPPSTIDPKYPRALETIVMKGLAPALARRYATAQELHQDLEAFARAHALNLSDGALARRMSELFAEELVTWMQARDTGVTLEDHVLQQVSRTVTLADPGPTVTIAEPNEKGFTTAIVPAPASNTLDQATRVLPRRKRQPRRTWLLPVLVVVLVAVAFVVTRWLLTA